MVSRLSIFINFLYLSLTPSSAWLVPENLGQGLYLVQQADESGRPLRAPIVTQINQSQNEAAGQNCVAEIAFCPDAYVNDSSPGASRPQKRGLGEVKPNVTRGTHVPKPTIPPSRTDSGWAASARIPLTIDEYSCDYNTRSLPLTGYSEARENLLNYCDRYGLAAETKQIAVSVSGDVLVYVCNLHKEKVNYCKREEFTWAEMWSLDRNCGTLVPGWVKSIDVDKIYGRAWKGQVVCEDIKEKVTVTGMEPSSKPAAPREPVLQQSSKTAATQPAQSTAAEKTKTDPAGGVLSKMYSVNGSLYFAPERYEKEKIVALPHDVLYRGIHYNYPPNPLNIMHEDIDKKKENFWSVGDKKEVELLREADRKENAAHEKARNDRISRFGSEQYLSRLSGNFKTSTLSLTAPGTSNTLAAEKDGDSSDDKVYQGLHGRFRPLDMEKLVKDVVEIKKEEERKKHDDDPELKKMKLPKFNLYGDEDEEDDKKNGENELETQKKDSNDKEKENILGPSIKGLLRPHPYVGPPSRRPQDILSDIIV